MRRFVPTLLLVTLPWTIGADFREVVPVVQSSVVTLNGDTATGTGLGTGFVVGDGTVLVTNYHVVKRLSNATARVDNGDEITITGVIATDPDGDLALLRIDQALPPLTLAQTPGAVGSAVLAVGNPRGLGMAYTDGMLSRVHYTHGYTVFQHSAPISPGNSGGPLLAENGEVIGINSFQLASEFGQNVNFAVDAQHIDELLKLAAPRIETGAVTALKDAEQTDIRFSADDQAQIHQQDCNAPTDPTWPLKPKVDLWEMSEVTRSEAGVCRHGSDQGFDLFYGRWQAPRAVDAWLDAQILDQGYKLAKRDGCTATFTRAHKPGDRKVQLVVTRNREVLSAWLQVSPADRMFDERVQGMFCDELDALPVAAQRR